MSGIDNLKLVDFAAKIAEDTEIAKDGIVDESEIKSFIEKSSDEDLVAAGIDKSEMKA